MNNVMNSAAFRIAESRAEQKLKSMNLTEKIGQLSQFGSSIYSKDEKYFEDHFENGKIGAYLTIKGAEKTNRIQKQLLSKMKNPIPALFGDDVIHGFKTVFPTPLAQSCSWNPELTKRTCEIAAKECYRAGIKWTFSPMVDIARDPRWGRVMEGYGEDTYLCSRFAEAAVKGYQGDGETIEKDHVYACMKHFIAYGACIGGRDYNSSDMSLPTLLEVYLPPFEAGLRAGAATFMTSFEDLNGVPATGNKYLLTDLLRNELGFCGFVVSDAGAVKELVPHGYAEDLKDAAYKAFDAGCDVVMTGDPYNDNLPALLEEGKLTIEQIDTSVRRVLTLKYLCGLMDEPTVDEAGEECFFCEEHMSVARKAAQECAVLLENNGILPLKNNVKKIALIGALAGEDSKEHIIGNWAFSSDNEHTVSIEEGLLSALEGKTEITYSYGCSLSDGNENDDITIANAVENAKSADVAICVLGEDVDSSGEAASFTNLHLQARQEELLDKIIATGTPVILLISSGRPLILTDYAKKVSALMLIWQMGSQAGNAVADLLTGKISPSGHLTLSHPVCEAQIPIYYNHNNTGRPALGQRIFEAKYRDCPIDPLYSFGYGLSYTQFEYSDIRLSSNTMPTDGEIDITLKLKNVGEYGAAAVVQLYIRDLVGCRVRPVKELKGFKKIFLNVGEEKEITLKLPAKSLEFRDAHANRVIETGKFKLWIAEHSLDEKYEFDFEIV